MTTAASVVVKAKIEQRAEVRKAEIEAETKRLEIQAKTDRVHTREASETERERIRWRQSGEPAARTSPADSKPNWWRRFIRS